jgi:broad specificity phosphatase PhoE
MTRIALVRHCESAGQAPEAPLTETGHAQALDLVGRLSSLAIDHIVCSPYARARATIQPFAMRAGLPVHLDDRLAVVVSHGQLLSLVLHSIDPGFGYAGWEALQNPDVYLLEGEPGPAFTFRRI